MNLRVKINLIVGVLMLMFVAAVLGLQVRSLKESVAEEVVAANRVASQLLNRTLWLYAAQGLPAMRAFLQGMGRVRANDIELFDEAGRRQYASPPSPYKSGREAPDWFVGLVAPPPSVQAIDFPGGKLVVRSDASRAVLDAWDYFVHLALIGMALLAAANVLVFWLVGSTVRPFSQIVRALNDLQGGRFDVALPALPGTEAAAIGAWMLHYSTDYVFDGSGSTPWVEDAATCPLGVYGSTKLEGEAAIRRSGCAHLILRTSWVYAARGSNFAKTMLKLARERDALRVIDDQIGAPTGADLLADVTAHALRQAMHQPDACGTYHVAASGQTSWHAYAVHVIEQARAQGHPIRVARKAIAAVPSSAFPTPARRPGNSRLDTRKLQNTFDLSLPTWQAGVDRMLAEVLDCPPAGSEPA